MDMTSENAGVRRRMYLAREAAKLTRVAVAKELGVTRQKISRWEDGTSHPTPEQMRDLCILYGVLPCYIFLGDDTVVDMVAQAMRAASAGGVSSR